MGIYRDPNNQICPPSPSRGPPPNPRVQATDGEHGGGRRPSDVGAGRGPQALPGKSLRGWGSLDPIFLPSSWPLIIPSGSSFRAGDSWSAGNLLVRPRFLGIGGFGFEAAAHCWVLTGVVGCHFFVFSFFLIHGVCWLLGQQINQFTENLWANHAAFLDGLIVCSQNLINKTMREISDLWTQMKRMLHNPPLPQLLRPCLFAYRGAVYQGPRANQGKQRTILQVFFS
jgi:hypothetical protein